jgi:transposase
MPIDLALTVLERAELVRRATNRTRPKEARRARIILMLDQGYTWAQIMDAVGCSRALIARWSARFAKSRVAGLLPRHHGQASLRITEVMERRIVRAAGHRLADGRRRWSTRGLAARLRVSHMTIQRVWRKHGLGRAAGSP